MRPIKLTMSAFGPYADQVVVDFDKLGENGLYLITGETGAGKTTIFDAITYALFGEASGSNRTDDMFRSKLADDSVPTEVKLVFSNKGQIYKVRRNPEYNRAKARGVGTTKQIKSAELTMPDGKVETQINNVNEKIKEILGVDRSQFSQIAMIAQGDFLKLLLATTEQRRLIFQQIFKTDIFASFQKKIKDNASELNNERNIIKNAVEIHANNIKTDENSPFYFDVVRIQGKGATSESILEVLDKLIDADTLEAEENKKKLDKCNKELEELSLTLSNEEGLQKKKKELSDVENKLQNAEKDYSDAEKLWESSKAREEERNENERKAAKIGNELPDYDELDNVKKDKESEENNVNSIKAEKEKTQQTLYDLIEEIEQKKEELKKLENIGEEKIKLENEKDSLNRKQQQLEAGEKDLEQLEADKREYEKAQKLFVTASKNADEAQNKAKEARRLFNCEQAGIMAELLCDGDPCPVCGSTVHPKKAEKSANAPTEGEVKRLEDTADELQQKANKASQDAAKLEGQIKLFSATVKEEIARLIGECETENSAERISEEKAINKTALDEIKVQLGEIDEKAKKKEILSREIPSLEEQAEGKKNKVAELERNLTGLDAKLEALMENAKSLSAKLTYESKEIALREKEKLEEFSKRIKNLIDEAQKSFDESREKVIELKTQKTQLLKDISEYKAENIEEIRVRKEELEEIHKKLSDSEKTIHNRLETNRDVREKITENAKELAILDEKYRWLEALSKTANGNVSGKEKITLETYIQMHYFERILRRATVHMMKMSRGKYDLIRSQVAENNKSQSGLEIDVVDHSNGSVRSVKSLSGGESFIASLSLALGLSEEIQASAGGVAIDTMFVDEGFGSLDDETLSEAMRALYSLADGNRLVGIISHVSELRRSIDKQIVVTKDKSGASHVEIKN